MSETTRVSNRRRADRKKCSRQAAVVGARLRLCKHYAPSLPYSSSVAIFVHLHALPNTYSNGLDRIGLMVWVRITYIITVLLLLLLL